MKNNIVEEFKSIISTTMDPIFTSQEAVSKEAYTTARVTFNNLLIQVALGATISTGKSGKAILKLNRQVPTMAEATECFRLLEQMIQQKENAFVAAFNAVPTAASQVPPDMGIPGDGSTDSPVISLVPDSKGINKKLMVEYIMGLNGKTAISTIRLTGYDFLKLVSIGEQLHKNKVRTIALVVTGATVVVATAAVVGGVMYTNNKKKETEKTIEENIAGELTDGEDVDVDVEVEVIDDVPHVELEAVSAEFVSSML